MPTSVSKLLRRGTLVGNVPLRKELRGKKLYASETGAIEHSILMTMSGGSLRGVSCGEAHEADAHRCHDEDAALPERRRLKSSP
jgi:hypothetical protein